jgi:hypothetical protein
MKDRSWMYDGAGGDPLLYFKYVTQFVEAIKMHALCLNKKEIWCPSKNCENNVLKSPANVMQSSTPKAFANDLSHLSMGTSESSKIFIEAAEETIDQCKLVL